MNAQSITFVSVLAGLVGYLGLTAFFVVGQFRRLTGRAALLAASVTTAWYAALLLSGLSPLSNLLELSSYLAWIGLLTRVLGVTRATLRDPSYRWQVRLALGAAAAYGVGAAVVFAQAAGVGLVVTAVPLAKLIMCLLGLMFVEQVARNTRRDFRWRLKFMTLGLGTVFGYGFILHADTVLFRAVSFTLFAPQGFVYALAVPMIALASLRNRTQGLNFNVSRQFVFRSGVLMLTGGYLIIMGVAGYYVRFFGGAWGDVFLVLVLVVGLLGFITLASSTQVQSALRVAIKRNLYQYKYDYRAEWIRVSNELTEPSSDDTLEERAIHAVGELVHVSSGVLLKLTDEQILVPAGEVNALETVPLSKTTTAALAAFFARREWIIDLDAVRADPASHPGLELTAPSVELAWARFVVPLPVGEQLIGVILLGPPSVPMTLDWEDFDTLKLVARQTAGFLALKQADEALATAAQFRVREELAAFVVHDLKTISGQLSLMLRNAEKHKANPEFQDDLLTTVQNAVGRMSRLLTQLRNPDGAADHTDVDLVPLVRAIIDDRASDQPMPRFIAPPNRCVIRTDAGQVRSALTHLIQNAQDATSDDGRVEITISLRGPWVHIDVTDTGEGMSEAFLKERLFSPFSTSKGVAGVGIGAYQARQSIRDLGGDLAVSSRRGKGTTFTMRLPSPPPPPAIGTNPRDERAATS